VLTITPAAAHVIDRLTADADAVGLRVTRADSGALSMGLAEGPEDDDTVVTTQSSDVVVFVDPVAAPRLEDAVLDAKSEPGAAAFFLR
jgi:Fe-S cluster assembly iron-binding protein IscA